MFDVDVVVLGGCFGPLAPWLADDVGSVLRKRVLSSAWTGCEVRASEFGEGAAVRGAAALTLMSVLAEPWRIAERSGRTSRKGFLTMRVRQRPGVFGMPDCCDRAAVVDAETNDEGGVTALEQLVQRFSRRSIECSQMAL